GVSLREARLKLRRAALAGKDWTCKDGLRLRSRSQADPLDQILKSVVFAKRVKEGMDFQVLQDNGFFLIGLFEPGQRLLVVAEAKVGVHKRRGRNIAFPLTELQFVKEPERFLATTRMRVRPDQNADDGRPTLAESDSFFQYRNGLLRLA